MPASPLTETFRILLGYLWPRDRVDLQLRLVLAFLALAFAKGANILAPWLYALMVDDLDRQGTDHVILIPLSLIFAYTVTRLGVTLGNELRDALFARTGQHAVRHAGKKVLQHVYGLSLRHHLDRQTGGMANAITRGSKAIESLLSFCSFFVFPTLLEFTIILVVFQQAFGWPYALILLAAISAYGFFTIRVTEWRVKFRRAMNDADEAASHATVDGLINYESVKLNNSEAHEVHTFDQRRRAYEQAAVRSIETLSVLNIGQGFLVICTLAVILWLAAGEVAAGTMTLGTFVLVNTYLIQLWLPLNFLGSVWRTIRSNLTDMEALFRLTSTTADVADKPKAPDLRIQEGRLEFRNVNFSYDSDRTILKEINFVVEPGQTVALVGETGSGKSTVGRLLLRFYDPNAGAVMIDGQDIASVTQASLRKVVGAVAQDVALFNATIGYNIGYGDQEADAETIRKAADAAQLLFFIESLPQGFDTEVGERGLKLSGGEKQRILISRCLLREPRILLLDEATSSLDNRTERDVYDAVRSIFAKRTMLVIAHRLSTVVDADRIFVMDAGRIIESGTHKELLAKGKTYTAMWGRQSRQVQPVPHPATDPAQPAAAHPLDCPRDTQHPKVVKTTGRKLGTRARRRFTNR